MVFAIYVLIMLIGAHAWLAVLARVPHPFVVVALMAPVTALAVQNLKVTARLFRAVHPVRRNRRELLRVKHAEIRRQDRSIRVRDLDWWAAALSAAALGLAVGIDIDLSGVTDPMTLPGLHTWIQPAWWEPCTRAGIAVAYFGLLTFTNRQARTFELIAVEKELEQRP